MNDTLTQDGKSITLNDAQMAIYKEDLNSKISWAFMLVAATGIYGFAKKMPEKEVLKLVTVAGVLGALYLHGNKMGIRKGLFLADVK
jgi:hypothetical protein